MPLGISFFKVLCFRQQSKAELPMPVNKESIWDLGSSVSQDTFSTEYQLTAQGLFGVTGQCDPGHHVALEALNSSARSDLAPGIEDTTSKCGGRETDELLEKVLNMVLNFVLLLFFSAWVLLPHQPQAHRHTLKPSKHCKPVPQAHAHRALHTPTHPTAQCTTNTTLTTRHLSPTHPAPSQQDQAAGLLAPHLEPG